MNRSAVLTFNINIDLCIFLIHHTPLQIVASYQAIEYNASIFSYPQLGLEYPSQSMWDYSCTWITQLIASQFFWLTFHIWQCHQMCDDIGIRFLFWSEHSISTQAWLGQKFSIISLQIEPNSKCQIPISQL